MHVRQWVVAASPFGLAAVATAASFLVIRATAPADSYLYVLFFDRSWIQPASTFCFWLAMALLWQKLRVHRTERDAYAAAAAVLSAPPFGPDQQPLNWTDASKQRRRFVDPPQFAQSLTFSRIVHALDRLHKTQSTQSMQEYCKARSEVDAAELDTGYADIRYLVWLIPTLGFIGTVMGIGEAITGFANVITNAADFSAVRGELPKVSYSLGTAFDTTLLALALSATVVLCMSLLVKRQEQVLSRIDTLCFDGLCASFQEHSTASREIVEAVDKSINQLIERMNGNRASIEAAFGSELQAASASSAERLEALGDVLRGMSDQQQRMIEDLRRFSRYGDNRPPAPGESTADRRAG